MVLNGCGIEGAAQKTADAITAAGFEHVTVDNATFYYYREIRVSYRYEEQRAEVDELAELLDVRGIGSVCCYGPDTKDWGKEYDVLVMVGDPSAAGNSFIAGAPVS